MANDYSFKCRTCLSESSIYHQLFDYVDENCKISEMLDCVVPQINIKTTSQFSNLLCLLCVEKLLTSYKFQQLCIATNNCLYGFLKSADCETQHKLENILHTSKADSVVRIKEEIVDPGCYEPEKPFEDLELQSDNDILQSNLARIDSDSSISGKYEDQCKELNEITSFQCRQCPKSFGKQNALSAHYKVHKKKQNRCVIITEVNSDATVKDTALDKNSYSNNEQIIPNRSNDVEKKTKKYVKYPCEVCGKIFGRPSCLRRHSKVHSLDRPYACKICQYRFTDAKNFRNHMFQHVKRFAFSKTLKANMSQHMNETRKNINSKTFKCTICQRNFMSMRALARHFEVIHPQAEKQKCDHCDKKFIFHSQLLKHLTRHKLPKSLKCQICGRLFANNDKFEQHMRAHDSYLNSQCGVNYLDQQVEAQTGIKEYQCRESPGRFSFKPDKLDDLTTHSNLNIKEENEDACFEPVIKLEELAIEFQQDDKNPTNNSIRNDSDCSISQTQTLLYETGQDEGVQCKELSEITTFQCRHCPKSFAKQTSLAAHSKVHKKPVLNKNTSGRKSEQLIQDVQNIFLPNYLEQNTNILTELYSDTRTEEEAIDENSESNSQPVIKTGAKGAKYIRNEKRYICKLCGKKFERTYNLQRHSSVHSSTRPHECEICKHRFAKASTLKSHLDRLTCRDRLQHAESAGGSNFKSTILDPLTVEPNIDVKEENEDELLESQSYSESEREFLSDDSKLINDASGSDTDSSISETESFSVKLTSARNW